MNSTKLANWSEIVSSAAILVTLIFLVVQMRQNTAAIEASTRQAALDGDAQFIQQALEHPETILTWTKSDPTDEEVLQHYYTLTLFLRIREASYAQYRSGVMDRATWERYRGVIPDIFQYPQNRAFWRNAAQAGLDPDFVAEVNPLIEERPLLEQDIASNMRPFFELQ